jgi:hypothetical protein
MAYKRKFGTKKRDDIWARESTNAYLAGHGRLPLCVHCDQPVYPDQAWDVSHVAVPRALGGKSVGCGHRKCNQLDNVKVVIPAVAKAERVRKFHCGISGPGLGPHPMDGGRRSRLSKTFRHGVQPRLTLAQKHQLFLARRAIVPLAETGEVAR